MQSMILRDPPPLRYTGGKWLLADWIINQMPPHETYCEPFCGGAAVFFRKHPSKLEILNDLSGDIVNFFTVLRTRTEDLVRAIDLTPYSREEYELSYQPCEDELERARRFYVCCYQSFGSFSGRRTGWRKMKNYKRGTSITSEWARLDGLLKAAARLKDAQIENRPAVEVLRDYDTPKTLFYVDPPYVYGTRSGGGRKRYVFEMTDDDHRQLANVLHQLEGAVILSGYQSELYAELYADWTVLTKTTTTNGNGSATEYLWMSPKAVALGALPLFDLRANSGAVNMEE